MPWLLDEMTVWTVEMSDNLELGAVAIAVRELELAGALEIEVGRLVSIGDGTVAVGDVGTTVVTYAWS